MTDDTAGDAAHTTSVVRLERDEWVIVNSDDARLRHHGQRLRTVLTAHRHAVAFWLHRPLLLQYRIGTVDTAQRIAELRAVGAQVAALRREAARLERSIRADRSDVIRELSTFGIPAAEIAVVLGIPTTAVPPTPAVRSVAPPASVIVQPDQLF